VTDSVLLSISDKSDDPIYKLDPSEVWPLFKEKFPNITPKNGISMRAMLAGDIVPVSKGRKKYVMILTSELELLDIRNAQVKAHNRVVRRHNKMVRNEQRRAAYDYFKNELGIDLERMMK
jgi:hypothetical protein